MGLMDDEGLEVDLFWEQNFSLVQRQRELLT
jgi:hypothetical protein